MRFHGVTMTGPFNHQKVSTLPVFDDTRDQSRVVWLQDGTIWYGSTDRWLRFAFNAGDASEKEDMYSDFLRSTFFLHGSYDDFSVSYTDPESLVGSTDMTQDLLNKKYTFSASQQIQSNNLFDLASGIPEVDYLIVYVDYIDSSTPTIEVTSNGGVNWNIVDNGRVFRIPEGQRGDDLRIRFQGGGTGELYSWGILYNKDTEAACTKYGLTYKKFDISSVTITLDHIYTVNAIMVFRNGLLLNEPVDYTADDGLTVTFNTALQPGDVVHICTFSTSILNQDLSDFIKKDGSVDFTDNQSMANNKITNLADATDDGDAVNYSQLNELNLDILKAIAMGTWSGDYYAEYTYNTDDLPTNIDISIPNDTSPTWTANILYTYNTDDLPTTVVYTYNGTTVTQTYTFDANDLPQSLTQVTT